MQLLRPSIDDAEIKRRKTSQPITVLYFHHTDRLPSQGLRDENPLAGPFDFPRRPNPTNRVVGIIPWLRHVLGHPSRRALVVFGGRLLAQRLVRPMMIELFAESVEPNLLLSQVGGRWPRRLRLQRAVHPLMPSVLFRVPGNDPLKSNAKLHPMHRQHAEPRRSVRCKWRAVVAADRKRQAVFFKHLNGRPAN